MKVRCSHRLKCQKKNCPHYCRHDPKRLEEGMCTHHMTHYCPKAKSIVVCRTKEPAAFLKPCPFCGGTAKDGKLHDRCGYIYCETCNLVFCGPGMKMDPEVARKAWNTRTDRC